MPSHAVRLRLAAEKYGETELALRAAALLDSGVEDAEFLGFVGGPPGAGVVDGSWPDYWARSWGARTLEHYWVDAAAASVSGGLADEHWRVRMICARVCGKRELGVPERLAQLCRDDYWRVREAAARALGRVGEGEHADVLRSLLDDDNATVRSTADAALTTLGDRLDREF